MKVAVMSKKLAAVLLSSASVFGALAEEKSFINPGYEAGTSNWRCISNGQDAITKFEVDATQIPFLSEGKQSLKITLTEKPKVYVCAMQGIQFPEKEVDLPKQIKISYKAPQTGAYLLFNYIVGTDRNDIRNETIALKPGENFQAAIFDLKVPEGMRALGLEIRVDDKGSFWFDDIRLVYNK
jgi:hypothetical protein